MLCYAHSVAFVDNSFHFFTDGHIVKEMHGWLRWGSLTNKSYPLYSAFSISDNPDSIMNHAKSYLSPNLWINGTGP